MSTNYAEMERAFIASLGQDTGRDLGQWMTAISESGQSERNAIIDWLRLQGFPFSKASWLERIHHNGGRLIYGGQATRAPQRPRTTPLVFDRSERPKAAETLQVRDAPKPTEAAGGFTDHPASLLSGAKGLRPLAELVLREIQTAVPNSVVTGRAPFVFCALERDFAALLPGPKVLRLYARFGAAGAGRALPAEPVNKAPPPFPDMLLLDDARAVDQEFRLLIRLASER